MKTEKKTVLFVEDENDLVDAYHLIFDDHGYRFLSTASIKDATMLCEREKIDLILLDILLPSEDGELKKMGFVFLKDLKANPKTKDIPVVILTNLEAYSDKQEGMKLGAQAYLIKSAKTPVQVLVKVEEILK